MSGLGPLDLFGRYQSYRLASSPKITSRSGGVRAAVGKETCDVLRTRGALDFYSQVYH